MFLLNSGGEAVSFVMPTLAKSKKWRLFLDTSKVSPKDVFPNLNGPQYPKNGRYKLPLKSSAVFVSEQ